MAGNAAARAGKPAPRPHRHVPLRTCVACGQSRDKRDLVRVVHTAGGPVEVDPTGKKPGRGAYLCRQASCWELAFKKRALDRALKTTIGAENRTLLEDFAKTLPQGQSGQEAAPSVRMP